MEGEKKNPTTVRITVTKACTIGEERKTKKSYVKYNKQSKYEGLTKNSLLK